MWSAFENKGLVKVVHKTEEAALIFRKFRRQAAQFCILEIALGLLKHSDLYGREIVLGH